MAKLTKKDRLMKAPKKEFSKKIQLFKFMDTLNLYIRLAVDKYTKGLTDEPDRPIEDGKFYYTTNRIFTKNKVKKMFFIKDLPEILPRGFITDLRADIQTAITKYNLKNDLNENVHVNFVIDGEHYNFDKSDRKVQGKWKHFTREYDKVQAKMGEKTLQDELKSDKYSDLIRRKVNSFLYIKEATEEEDSALFKTTFILELCGTTNESLSEAEKCLDRFIFKHRIKVKDVFIQTNEYQKAFTPVSVDNKRLLKQMIGSDVLADDTLTSMTLTTHGKVGDDVGIYHGIDVFSHDIVPFDFSKGSDSNNILLTASTGEGKSNYAKMLYTFISAMQETYATIIFDYEGTDYRALGKVTDAKTVSFTGGSGSYVNTMVIGDLTGDKLIDEGLMIEARESTKRVFDILCDENSGMTTTETAIFSEAMKILYTNCGVFDDRPETWTKSKGLTFYKLFAKILEMRDTNKYMQEFGTDAMFDFIIKLKPYFEEGQIRTGWFKKPIAIQELIDSKNIIFDFGMAGKDDAMTEDKSIALRQSFASYITLMVAGRNKVKGLRTVVMIEELQRYLQQLYSGQIINSIATGGRKLGIIGYFITNAPGELLDLEENFQQSNDPRRANVSSLLDSLNMQIIGATGRVTMLKLIKRFNLENSASYLDALVKIRENKQKKADFKYCFHIAYKGQATLVRMLCHPDLVSLPLYSTRDDSVSNKKSSFDDLSKNFQIGEEDLDRILDESIKKERELSTNNASWFSRVENSEDNLKNVWKNIDVDD